MSTKTLKSAVGICVNFPYGRADGIGVVRSSDSETSTALPGGLELNQQSVIGLTTLQFTELRSRQSVLFD